MFFERYRSINFFFISCCFIINIKAQDADHLVHEIVDIKEGIQLINEDSLLEIDPTNFRLKLNKVGWYDSNENSSNIIIINENDFRHITLPYNNAFVKVEFDFKSSLASNNSKFKYKVRGLYSSWKALEKTNEVTFTHLTPGDYVLEIIYSTGTSNIKTLKIPIIVNQVYYKKWWFIVAVLCFVGFLLFCIRKYELYHIDSMEELRLKISRDLHDELGSTLTGIAIKSDLLLQEIEFRCRKEILFEIAEQSRSAVYTLSDIIWATDSSNNSVQNLTERMESLLHQFLNPLNITFTLQSIENKKPLLINQDYRQHVFLIFKEAITNIMKHSNGTHVFVSITKNKNKLKLTIKDNGTKIPEECSTLNGNGIKNIKLRAKKINGMVQFVCNEGFKVELLFNYLDKKTTSKRNF